MTELADRPATAPRTSTAKSASLLTARQRTALRTHLSGDREKIRLLIDQLDTEMESFTESRRDAPTDDEHDPEGPTIAFERSQSSAIRAQSLQHIADIDSALLRMDLGTYGVCRTCAGPIAVGRLQARPQAPLCIDCAARIR